MAQLSTLGRDENDESISASTRIKAREKNASTTAAAGWRHDNCQLSRQLNTLACNPSLVQMLSNAFRWDFYRKKEIIIAFVVYYHCSHGFEYHMNQRYCTAKSMLIFVLHTLRTLLLLFIKFLTNCQSLLLQEFFKKSDGINQMTLECI